MPPAVATRFQVVPFALEAEQKLIWLAVPDPADLNRQDELQFALGCPVALALAPEILLKRALAKYYGVAHERRFIKLHTDGDRKRKRRPISAANAILDAPQMLKLLAGAPGQSEVLDLSLDCLASFAEDVTLLTLDECGLAGWGRRRDGATVAGTDSVRIELAETPAIRILLAAKSPLMLDAAVNADLHALLCSRLGLDRRGRLAVLTLCVGDRTMGCFVLGRFRREVSFDPAKSTVSPAPISVPAKATAAPGTRSRRTITASPSMSVNSTGSTASAPRGSMPPVAITVALPEATSSRGATPVGIVSGLRRRRSGVASLAP